MHALDLPAAADWGWGWAERASARGLATGVWRAAGASLTRCAWRVVKFGDLHAGCELAAALVMMLGLPCLVVT